MSSIDLSSFTAVVVESVCFLFTAFRDTNELKFSLHFASNVLLLYIRNPFFLHLPNIFCAFSLEFFTPKKITDKSPNVVLARVFSSPEHNFFSVHFAFARKFYGKNLVLKKLSVKIFTG